MKRADQILADIQFGDAVTDHAFALQKRLRRLGFESEIYAENIHPSFLSKIKKASDYTEGDLLIHHFAIGSELNEKIKEIKGVKKVFVYHNITPPEFFEGYNLHSQTLCIKAREQLKTLSDTYDMSIAVSEYNCSELRELGFSNLRVLPILYDFGHVSQQFDQDFLSKMKDKKNILFLGRIAPNKRQEDVIKAFYLYHKICPESRLFLVGSYQGMEKYLNELVHLTTLLDLQNDVVFTGKVSYEVMTSLYRGADLFLSMSEHEGFCVPLLESMYFQLPILAYSSSAISETLGSGGVLFYEKNYPLIAEMMVQLTHDEGLRKQIIDQQTMRLQQLSEEKIGEQFEKLIKELNV